MTDVKRLGVIHLFCISGMHVVLLITILRWLGVYLWLDREVVDGILILALPFYLIIAGGAPSLIRAVIMAEAGLLQDILKLDRLDSWAMSLLIGMAWEPAVLLSLGGQLSYLLSFLLQVMDRQITALRQCLFLSAASLPAILSYVFEFHWLSLVISYPMIPPVFVYPLSIGLGQCRNLLAGADGRGAGKPISPALSTTGGAGCPTTG